MLLKQLTGRARTAAVATSDRVRAARLPADGSGLHLIVATGRSGTHWLARTLRTHPDVTATIEAQPQFRWVTTAASQPSTRPDLLPKIVRRYQTALAGSTTACTVDKSHPALFLAPDLTDALPGVRFIAIQRKVESVVASGLRHDGVRAWVEATRPPELPNPFLGISADNWDTYRTLGPAGKLAVRWNATQRAIAELAARLPDHCHLVDYERLHDATDAELARLQQFMQLSVPIQVQEVRSGSLNRWQTDLTAEHLADIERGLAVPLPGPFDGS